jgi:hypothetical protein
MSLKHVVCLQMHLYDQIVQSSTILIIARAIRLFCNFFRLLPLILPITTS